MVKSLIKKDKVWRKVGCYVFSVKKTDDPIGYIPIYVGKAKKTAFGKECFSAGKITKINKYWRDHKNIDLFLFLIKHPKQKGRINGKAINEMEKFLIRLAANVNADLINIKNKHGKNWSIHGVLKGGGKGKPSTAALALRDHLEIDGG